MIRKLLAVTAGLLTAVLMSGVPGLAADDGGTDSTITITSTGGLAISGPNDDTPVNIGSADYGTGNDPVTWTTGALGDMATLLSTLQSESDLHGQLGTISVVDSRTGLVVSWTSTVSWTDFKLDGTGSATDEVIEAANLRYAAGNATTEGIGTFTPVLSPVTSGGTAADYAGALQTSGSNTVEWNPTIYVDLQGEKAGIYSGTITHSVTGS